MPVETVFINTYAIADLAKAFAEVAAPPKRYEKALDVAFSLAPDVLELATSKGVGSIFEIPQKLYQTWREEKAIYAAAWRWLRPSTDMLELGHLPAMQTSLKLQHLSTVEFCRRAIQVCSEIREKHAALARYIGARMAELEFKILHDDIRETAASEFELYQRHLLLAALSTDVDGAVQRSHALAREVLATTGYAAAVILGDVMKREDKAEEQCVFTANLMVPVNVATDVAGVEGCLGELGQTPGAKSATWLWHGVREQIDKVLVVIAETEGSSYSGFWIPDVRPDGHALPGAPRALENGSAQALFVDDLPPFPIEDDETRVRWQRYLRGGSVGHFRARMFVSIPIFKRVSTKQSIPEAVINVNVHSDRLWKRAYSRAWLDFATSRLNPWIATAWHAEALALGLHERKLIDMRRVDGLELGSQVARLLEGGRK